MHKYSQVSPTCATLPDMLTNIMHCDDEYTNLYLLCFLLFLFIYSSPFHFPSPSLTIPLLSSLIRYSLNMVECWQLSDQRLSSTLGRSDGEYVSALYAATQQEPLNKTEISEGYRRYLKHVLNPEGSANENQKSGKDDILARKSDNQGRTPLVFTQSKI